MRLMNDPMLFTYKSVLSKGDLPIANDCERIRIKNQECDHFLHLYSNLLGHVFARRRYMWSYFGYLQFVNRYSWNRLSSRVCALSANSNLNVSFMFSTKAFRIHGLKMLQITWQLCELVTVYRMRIHESLQYSSPTWPGCRSVLFWNEFYTSFFNYKYDLKNILHYLTYFSYIVNSSFQNRSIS